MIASTLHVHPQAASKSTAPRTARGKNPLEVTKVCVSLHPELRQELESLACLSGLRLEEVILVLLERMPLEVFLTTMQEQAELHRSRLAIVAADDAEPGRNVPVE